MDDEFLIFRLGFGCIAWLLFLAGTKIVRAVWGWNHFVGVIVGAAALYIAGLGVDYMIRGCQHEFGE